MESYLLKHLGGDTLRETAPLLYSALCDIKPAPVKNNFLSDTSFDTYMNVEEVFFQKNTSDTGILQRTSFASKISFMVAVSELYDNETGELLETYNEYWENFSYSESKLISTTERAKLAAKKPRRLVTTFTWSDDGVQLHEEKKEIKLEQFNDDDPLITSLNVTAPRAKNHKLTNVLYDREQFYGEDVDYHYTNVILPNNKAKVMMPFSGSIQADSNCIISRINTSISEEKPLLNLILVDGGAVSYGFDAEHFVAQFQISSDKKSISWDFNLDWNAILDLSHFSANTIVQFSCQFTLVLQKIGEVGKEFHPRIMITSTPQSEEGSSGSIEIEPIQIKWGCIAAGTLVRMIDGSNRKIEDIRPDDFVCTEDAKSVRVIDTVRGMDDVYRLETQNGKGISITASHPVKTTTGFVRGDNLTVADIICTEDGVSPVKHLFTETEKKEVYNLILENSAPVFAGGIIVGDFELQNSLSFEVDKKTPPTPLQLEMRNVVEKNSFNVCHL